MQKTLNHIPHVGDIVRCIKSTHETDEKFLNIDSKITGLLFNKYIKKYIIFIEELSASQIRNFPHIADFDNYIIVKRKDEYKFCKKKF